MKLYKILLDTKKLDEMIGYKAEMSKGVYKYTIGRPDVKLLNMAYLFQPF